MEDSLSSMSYPSNDERGWIMTSVSALGEIVQKPNYSGSLLTVMVACILGASIIMADIPMRLIPRYKNFRIQDSTKFLSSSMALSFGVMVSLYPTHFSYNVD